MKRTLTTLFVILLLITSCAQDKKDQLITIRTSHGDMVAILYDETPKHKANFIKLAKEHYFDSMLFHRVISGFMIQSGDPDSKKAPQGQPLGSGGPKWTVDAEFVPALFHEKGALSAARQGDNINPKKASSGSQFYIVQGRVLSQPEVDRIPIDQKLGTIMTGLRMMSRDPANAVLIDSLNKVYYRGDVQAYEQYVLSLGPRVEKATGLSVPKIDRVPEARAKVYMTLGGAPHLDDQYTVFGKVIKGLEVVDKIASVPVMQERPIEDVRIISVTVEEMPKKKITKDYGYQYPATKK